MTIFKYPVLYKHDKIYADLPLGAKVLSINIDHIEKTDDRTADIYAIVNEHETKTIEREVLWLGTEAVLTKEEKLKIKEYKFLGTHIDDDHYAWHVWIEPEPRIMELYNEQFSKLLMKNFAEAVVDKTIENNNSNKN